MANLSPEKQFQETKDGVLSAVSSYFPIVGKKHTLRLASAEFRDNLSPDDVHAQKAARLNRQTWGVPLTGQLELVDNESGEVLDSRRRTLLRLPKITREYTYIVRGQARSVQNQFRLKSGIYAKRRQNGELTSQINLKEGLGFNINMAPKGSHMILSYPTGGGSRKNVNLYTVLRVMGVPDSDIEKEWGSEAFLVNRKKSLATNKKRDVDVQKLYQAMHKKQAPDLETAIRGIRDTFSQTSLFTDTTKKTLGEGFDKISGRALLLAAKKLYSIAREEDEPDNLEDLGFKEVWSVEDHLPKKIEDSRREILRRVNNNLDRKKEIRDILSTGTFNLPVRSFFTQDSRSVLGDQTNPLTMISDHLQTTLMGPGGIGSENMLTTDNTIIDKTHLGFLDPMHTPECFLNPHRYEVLTLSGWKSWDDVDYGDRIACRMNGELEFHYPIKIIREEYEGPGYEVIHPRVSWELTPNHRVWSKPLCGTKWRFSSAEEVHGRRLKITSTHLPYVSGVAEDYFRVPGTEVDVLMMDWLEFMGWFLSEGSYSKYEVTISQTNPQWRDQIKDLCQRLPFEFREGPKAYYIKDRNVAAYCAQFGKCHEKFIPGYVFEAPPGERDTFIQTMLRGDGRLESSRPNGVSYKQQVLTTTSEQMAKQFEMLGILSGYAVTVNRYEDKREERYLDTYDIRFLRYGEWQLHPEREKSPCTYRTFHYKGQVACAEVPGGMLYVRRADIPHQVGYWTGNSKKTGVVQHLPLGVVKKGKTLFTPAWNVKKKQMEYVDPTTLHEKTVVAFPDQYEWVDGKPKPVGKQVYAMVDGERKKVGAKVPTYVLPSSSAMFGPLSAIVPFVNHNHGARVMMADRQMSQALPLVHRTAPKVQVATGFQNKTFEDVFGQFASHTSPVNGEVVSVKKDLITVRDKKGQKHRVQLYNNYPLNDAKGGVFLDATPLVKPGDKVKKDQALADTNYTKNGQLAMGVDLKTAFMSSGGENFEDGVVISETASQKLTSPHLYRFTVEMSPDIKLGKRDYLQHFHHALSRPQAEKLNDMGIIQVGQKVSKGDTLIAALRKAKVNKASEALRKMKKVLFKGFDDHAQLWDKENDGEVVDVVQKGRFVTVYVRSDEPMREGDKIAGRHGNKGIVVRILPDEQMPRTKKGEPVEVLMNPTTVPTRINLGQVLEVAAGKISDKTGKPYKVENFSKDKNRAASLMNELKTHGIDEDGKEELFSPDGKSLGRIGVGPQHIIKLKHQVEKKTAVRGRDAYDINESPKRGGKTGAQKMDSYGSYALLAHGARGLLREKHTHTATRNDRLWEAIENGMPIPPPQQTFAYKKFVGYLGALGVNVEKRGHHLKLLPFTDEQILSRSSGEIRNPGLMLFRDKEEPGGLFDRHVTGGLDGKKWSHFALSEPIPNPLFFKGILALTGLKKKEFADLAIGQIGLKGGEFVPGDTPGAVVGGQALYSLLDRVNVRKDLADAERDLKGARKPLRAALRKKVRYLRALAAEDLPATAYMLKNVPVMPPAFRPVLATDDNSPFRASLNSLYKYVGMTNQRLREMSPMMPKSERVKLRRDLLGQVWKLFGAEGKPYPEDHSAIPRKDQDTLGILEQIAGRRPADGYFQDRVVAKRQDLSMRTTITVGSDLDMDEVGLPRRKALKLFGPLVKAELKRRGLQRQAQDLIDVGDKKAYDALQHVLRRPNPDGTEHFHPVILKRDPALHAFSTMAYKVKLVDGDAIRLHPLSCEGFNADFDGDQMAAFVPVSPSGIQDAKRMLPSSKLFSTSSGEPVYKPSQDAIWGLYEMSRVRGKKAKAFGSTDKVLSAYKAGSLGMNDRVRIGNLQTTAGRIMIDGMLPAPMRGGRVLTDPNYLMDKSTVKSVLRQVGKKHPDHYADTVQHFLRNGNRHAYQSGRTIALDDLRPVVAGRETILAKAHREADQIRNQRLAPEIKRERIINVYNKATKELRSHMKERLGQTENALFHMNRSGARGSIGQVSQALAAPMLVQDGFSRTREIPITKSYAEGLDFGSYWDTQHGARKGIVQRATGTSEPGALSKKLINTTMHMLVSTPDCETKEGIQMAVTDPNVVDRVLAKPLQVKGEVLESGTVLTSDLRDRIAQSEKGLVDVVVRSPIKCRAHDGMCSKCFGLNENGRFHELGTNVGIIAGQSLGEPLSQGSMDAFHEGGIASGRGAQSVSKFDRAKQLTEFPKKLPGATTLATKGGVVDSVRKGVGGWEVVVNGVAHKTRTQPRVKRGDKVTRGAPLSEGNVNPRELLSIHGPQTGMRKVRAYLTQELGGLFDTNPYHRRNVEVVVRGLTNLSEVRDPGKAPGVLPGDLMSTSAIDHLNATEDAEIKAAPILKGANVLPLEQTEDWIARMNYAKLRRTVTDAALQGWKSDIHGYHPIPALVYGKEFGYGTKTRPWAY